MKLLKRLSLFLLVAVLLVTMIPSAFAANSFTTCAAPTGSLTQSPMCRSAD